MWAGFSPFSRLPNAFPYFRALVRVCLKEQAGKVLIKRGWEDNPQELDIDDKSQRDKFYEGIVERIKDYFSREPQGLVEASSQKKTIGFTID